MTFNRKLLASGVAIALLAGCQSVTKQDIGMVTGGVLGGALGSQVGGGTGTTVAIVAGTLLGAAIGGSIGRSMDEQDRMRTARALEYSPTGQPTSWRNPDNGYQYTVTPTQTYDTNSGVCRDFTTVGVIDGQRETVKGKACRQPDGTWKMM